MELNKNEEEELEAQRPKSPEPLLGFWQLNRDRLLTIIGIITITILTLYLVLLINAEHFAPFLESVGLKGLYNRQAGVYTDCSLEENRNVRYCQPKESRADREWRDLTYSKGTGKNKGAVFSLSGN